MYEYDKKPRRAMEAPREGLQMNWMPGVGRQAGEESGQSLGQSAGMLASALKRRFSQPEAPAVRMPPVKPTATEPAIPIPGKFDYGRTRNRRIME